MKKNISCFKCNYKGVINKSVWYFKGDKRLPCCEDCGNKLSKEHLDILLK